MRLLVCTGRLYRSGERCRVTEARATRIAVAFARQAAAVPPSRLCSACVDVLKVSGAGITLMSRRHSGPVCASNKRSGLLEELQFSLGEGPCRDAYASGAEVSEPDLSKSRVARWPNYTSPALAIGARGVFAFPLQVGVGCIGVLTLYQDDAGPLSDEQTADSLVLAKVLAETVIGVQSRNDPEVLADELTDDSSHRAQVHQATGIVAVQLGIDVSEALVRMRGHAFATDRRISDSADDIVAHRLRLTDDGNSDA